MEYSIENLQQLLCSDNLDNKKVALAILEQFPDWLNEEQVQVLLLWYRRYRGLYDLIQPLLQQITPTQVERLDQALYIFRMTRFAARSRINEVYLKERFDDYAPFHDLIYAALNTSRSYVHEATIVLELMLENSYQVYFVYQWYQQLYKGGLLTLREQIDYTTLVYDHIVFKYEDNYDKEIEVCLEIIARALPQIEQAKRRTLYFRRACMHCTHTKNIQLALKDFEQSLEQQGYTPNARLGKAAQLLYEYPEHWDKAYAYSQRAIKQVYFHPNHHCLFATLLWKYKQDKRRAIAHLEDQNQQFPNHSSIQQLLKQLKNEE